MRQRTNGAIGHALNRTSRRPLATTERIRELALLKQQLASLRKRSQTEQSVDACGILQGLAAMPTESKPERPTHLG